MDYKYLDQDAKEVMAVERRRIAELAVGQAILADAEAERVDKIARSRGTRTPEEREAAKAALGESGLTARRNRKQAEAMIAKAGLKPAEVREVEEKQLRLALESNERQHVYVSAELEMRKAAVAALDDDERELAQMRVDELQRQLGLIEMSHDLLLSRVGKPSMKAKKPTKGRKR